MQDKIKKLTQHKTSLVIGIVILGLIAVALIHTTSSIFTKKLEGKDLLVASLEKIRDMKEFELSAKGMGTYKGKDSNFSFIFDNDLAQLTYMIEDNIVDILLSPQNIFVSPDSVNWYKLLTNEASVQSVDLADSVVTGKDIVGFDPEIAQTLEEGKDFAVVKKERCGFDTCVVFQDLTSDSLTDLIFINQTTYEIEKLTIQDGVVTATLDVDYDANIALPENATTLTGIVGFRSFMRIVDPLI